MPECHLSICNVSRKYCRLQAVSHVSAELTEGVYTLLGPNGAGKTTLLSILADLLRPSSGRVCWNDREVHSMGREYRRLLGYLPQKPGFYPDFTGRRMLEYFACLQDIRKPGRRIEELLELVHLREDAERCCGTYSAGMLRRLGMAAALLSDPKLLLLDEPTCGLDPEEQHCIRKLIGQLSGGRIVLLAAHSISDLEMTAGQVLFLRQGRLLAADTPEQLCKSLEGKVWIVRFPLEKLGEYAEKHPFSCYRESGSFCTAVAYGDVPPVPDAVPGTPELEDVYLYYFAGEKG